MLGNNTNDSTTSLAPSSNTATTTTSSSTRQEEDNDEDSGQPLPEILQQDPQEELRKAEKKMSNLIASRKVRERYCNQLRQLQDQVMLLCHKRNDCVQGTGYNSGRKQTMPLRAKQSKKVQLVQTESRFMMTTVLLIIVTCVG